MYRLHLMILLMFLGAPVLWAQETETETETETDASEPASEEAAAAESEVTDEDIDELLGLDKDYTEVEDDDFESTESVRFEQSVPFPVDI